MRTGCGLHCCLHLFYSTRPSGNAPKYPLCRLIINPQSPLCPCYFLASFSFSITCFIGAGLLIMRLGYSTNFKSASVLECWQSMSLIRNYVTTQKWRKVWGPFVQRAIGRKPKADHSTIREVRKCVPLHSKIVNKPHQSFLMLSSRGTSRNVIPSIQNIPLGPHTFRHFLHYFCIVT